MECSDYVVEVSPDSAVVAIGDSEGSEYDSGCATVDVV